MKTIYYDDYVLQPNHSTTKALHCSFMCYSYRKWNLIKVVSVIEIKEKPAMSDRIDLCCIIKHINKTVCFSIHVDFITLIQYNFRIFIVYSVLFYVCNKLCAEFFFFRIIKATICAIKNLYYV